MQIAILGTTPMTKECALRFQKNNWKVSAIVSLPESMRPLNSIDLKRVADQTGAIYYETADLNDKETELFLSGLKLDYIFSTWPYLIKDHILQIPKYDVIGSHPTQLPYNRGRHPLHWLISMGITESYMSFFIMDSGIDSGNILVQEKYLCTYEVGIQDVYEQMMHACLVGIDKLCTILETSPGFQGIEQDGFQANYWRKRNIFDIIIDFRMSAEDIVRLVKSFNKPYECAVMVYKEYMIRVGNAEIVPFEGGNEDLQRIEIGRIVQIGTHDISVKAADQIVQLFVESDVSICDFGKYIYPPAKYIVEEPRLFEKLLLFK